jgi:DNA-binding transcriptional regulator YiaG
VKRTRKTYGVHVPANIDVGAIRTKLKISQNAFAARFGILPSTLRDWEQNRREAGRCGQAAELPPKKKRTKRQAA